MTNLIVVMDLEGALPPEAREQLVRGQITTIGAMPHGMVSGKPSVGIVVALDNGTLVYSETSLALLLSAADALKATHGDPRRDDDPVAAE